METLEDAIDFFRGRGVLVRRRVWSLGDTLVVPFGSLSTSEDDIQLHRQVAWILADSTGAWQVVQPVMQHERRRGFPSLGEACQEILELGALYSRDEECPSCRAKRAVDFGEVVRAGRSFWYVATRCDGCGAQTEADGADVLPEDLRRVELRRQGTWQLRIESVSESDGWRVVREGLGLSIRALQGLRRALPVVALEGTVAEILAAQMRLASPLVALIVCERSS